MAERDGGRQGKRTAPRAVRLALALLAAAAPLSHARAETVAFGIYADDAAGYCTAAGCSAAFSVIPGGRTVILTNASCRINLAGAAVLTDMRLLTSLGAQQPSSFSYLKPILLGVYSDGQTRNVRTYNSDDAVAQILPSGSHAVVSLSVTGADPLEKPRLACHVAGLMKP